ncbi:nuclear RNA export factor 3-like [Trichechus manatus latirostris]|uniref:Nuclear RNA export factor 3-like n=1 Tax=Trichechus manatus latirostris TaxID=127582 RepID=A0A2Y9FZK8_TRIMA|nr:nuclear RNA export factor 3-like [Trichechus manatus latirostris]
MTRTHVTKSRCAAVSVQIAVPTQVPAPSGLWPRKEEEDEEETEVEEDSHQVNSLQRRARCWGIFQRRYVSWSETFSPGIHPSSRQEQDGDVAMRDAHVGPGVRYTPYAIPTYWRRDSFHRGDQTHGNPERERKPPEEGLEGNRQDGTSRSWFKVIFPFGIKYDEKWLLNLIQSQCSVPFNPIEFHYEKMQVQFFGENASIAFALKKVSGKIWDEENERISIFVSPSAIPHSEQKKLKSTKVKLIKVMQTQDTCTHTHSFFSHQFPPTPPRCQSHFRPSLSLQKTNIKGHEVPQRALDLQRLHSDPDPMTLDIEKGPNLRNCMAASLHIHEENMRKVNSEGELDKVKGLEPEERCSDRNPLCTTFPDKSTNISSILELFSKLLHLDDHKIPPPIIFGNEAYKKLPVCKGNVFGSETLKNLILQFLQQYYWIYDSGDRQGLLDAYHDEACFSLTILLNPDDLVPSCLHKYSMGSRNIRKLKDPVLRVQLLKHTKRDIVDFLSVLPKTQHDLSSFVVDMCVQTEKMLCFSVNGVFKEVEEVCQARVRAFTRIFIATPASNFSLCIVNDQLFVSDAGPIETQGAFSTPVPTLSSSSVPTISQEQQEVAQVFSTQSGMNH